MPAGDERGRQHLGGTNIHPHFLDPPLLTPRISHPREASIRATRAAHTIGLRVSATFGAVAERSWQAAEAGVAPELLSEAWLL